MTIAIPLQELFHHSNSLLRRYTATKVYVVVTKTPQVLIGRTERQSSCTAGREAQ